MRSGCSDVRGGREVERAGEDDSSEPEVDGVDADEDDGGNRSSSNCAYSHFLSRLGRCIFVAFNTGVELALFCFLIKMVDFPGPEFIELIRAFFCTSILRAIKLSNPRSCISWLRKATACGERMDSGSGALRPGSCSEWNSASSE